MAKYSPATTMKPKNQRPKPIVSPATAHALARLNSLAGDLSLVSKTQAPTMRSSDVNPSTAMIAT